MLKATDSRHALYTALDKIDRPVYSMFMAKRNTKAELLDHGVRLLLDHGYHSTGIQEVLKAAEVPKGSFYHHFGSKEDFGLQAAEQYADAGYQLLDAMLNDKSKAPLERVRGFFEQIFQDWSSGDCRHGCLLGNLGQELADVNEPFREFIARTMDRWTERIAQCLAEAQQDKSLPAESDPLLLAHALMDGFEGAALRMKLAKTPEPLERFISFYFGQVLAH